MRDLEEGGGDGGEGGGMEERDEETERLRAEWESLSTPRAGASQQQQREQRPITPQPAEGRGSTDKLITSAGGLNSEEMEMEVQTPVSPLH